MARGRKPIPRTKEEALQTRKEQICRNVRAFRDRKKVGEGENNADIRNGGETFSDGHHVKICHSELAYLEISPPLASYVPHLLVDVQSSAVPHGLSTALSTADDPSNLLSPSTLTDELPRDRHLSSSARPVEPSANSLVTDLGAGYQFAGKSGSTLSWYNSMVTEKITLPAPGLLLVSPGIYSLLPREVGSALLTRQQLVANSSTLFAPPNHGNFDGIVDLGPHWAKNVLLIVAPRDVVEESLYPLCLLQIAHLKQDRSLLSASRYYYGQALRALRTCCRPASVGWRQLFLCAMTLGIYELLYDTGDGCVGWHCHVNGASSYLTEFAKFDEFRIDISYFYYLEAVCIFNPLMERKSSRLSTSALWRRSIDQHAGETYGSLLRLITSLPAYLEHFDYLAALPSGTDTQNRKQVLLDHGLLLGRRFEKWCENAARRVPSFYCEEDANTLVPLETQNPAPPDAHYSFPSLWIARLYLMYWASVILLLEAMIALVLDLCEEIARKPTLPSSSYEFGNQAVLADMSTQANVFATYIRRSTAFCLRPCNGLAGKSIILLPLSVAQKHLRQTDA